MSYLTNDVLTCTIEFCAEAYDSADRALTALSGLGVTVYPANDGEAFNATLGGVVVDDHSGEYRASFRVWDSQNYETDEIRQLDIYTDIIKMEVL